MPRLTFRLCFGFLLPMQAFVQPDKVVFATRVSLLPQKRFLIAWFRLSAFLIVAIASPSISSVTTNTLLVASSLAQAHKYAEAITIYDAIIKNGGAERIEALYQKGSCLSAEKQYDKAIACWEKALSSAPVGKADGILLEIAKTYGFDMKQPEKAFASYERFFRSYPLSTHMPEARYQYAGVFYQKGDYAKAQALFAQFIKDNPKSDLVARAKDYSIVCDNALESSKKANQEKEQIRQTASTSNVQRVLSRMETELQQGERLFQQNLFREALKHFLAVKNLTGTPGFDLALYRAGQCYSMLGDDNKAIENWQAVVALPRCITNSPYADQCLFALGDTRLDKLADLNGALKNYHRLVAEYPESLFVTNALEQIAIVYLYLGRTAEAKAVLEKLAENETPNTNAPPSGRDRLIQMASGKRGDWLPDLTVTAKGNKAATKIRLGDIYFTNKEYRKAARAYEKAEELVPETEEGAYAQMQKGRCHNQLREYKQVRDCYLCFLYGKYQKSYWSGPALVRLGVFEIRTTGNEEAGKKALQVAVNRADPEWAQTALYYLAMLDLWEGRSKKALDQFQKLVVAYPQGPYVAYVTQTAIPQIMLKKEGK